MSSRPSSPNSAARRLALGALVLGLGTGLVACGGGGEESSDLSREDLLAILETVQVDPGVAETLSDEQLQDAVDQIFAGLENLPAPDSTVAENPDVTAGGDEATPSDSTSAPVDTVAPAPEASVAPEGDDGATAPFPSVVITLPGVSIPIGNLLGALSTLAIADVSTSDSGGIRTYSITVTENGLGPNDITSVKVDWIVDGLSTPLTATKASDVSPTKSVWTVQAEAGAARMTITARDKNGAKAVKSFIFDR